MSLNSDENHFVVGIHFIIGVVAIIVGSGMSFGLFICGIQVIAIGLFLAASSVVWCGSEVDKEDILSALDDNEKFGESQSLDDPDPNAYMRGFRAAMILASASVKGVLHTDDIAKDHGFTGDKQRG
jgi:hypothetical protein